ncbi:MAG: branched-chain amino acid ABC transporter permease [Candidatus Rokuibacteriota bacterium]
MLLQQLVNGVVLGSVYALIAVGFSLVFSVLEIINFSHGSMLMLGAYFGLVFIGYAGWGFIPAMLGSALLVAVAGAIVERATVAPLRARQAPRVLALISTIGASIALEAIAQLVWGADVRGYPSPFPSGGVELGGVRVTHLELLIVGVTAVQMALLGLYIRYSRTGRAIRAIAQNLPAAALMGIDTDRTILAVFAIGSAIGAVAGMLAGAYFSFAQPSMGFLPGIKGFVAAVLGGMGSVVGAGLGGLLLGLVEALGGGFLSFAYKDAIVFGVLILILVLRPSGILGYDVRERV